MFLVFAVAAVMVVIATVRGDGPPVWFTALWLAALGWNAYWWLIRTCSEVRTDASTLEWSTPLGHGEVPLFDIVRVRSSRLGRQIAVIELQGRRPLLVPVLYGFSQLARFIGDNVPPGVVEDL